MQSQKEMIQPAAGRASRGLSILVVDDQTDILRFLERFLTSHGHAVCTRDDPRHALDELESRSFDLILLDVAMPGMTGLEFLHVLRETGNRVPVVMITGNPSIDSVTNAVEYGIDGYLIKPFSADELSRAVERIGLKRSTAA